MVCYEKSPFGSLGNGQRPGLGAAHPAADFGCGGTAEPADRLCSSDPFSGGPAVLLPETHRQGRTSDGVSPFQALCTALAATVGTGNLAGVAGAITLGGPGAIFWMWVCAFFGMVTKYAEVVLALRFRVRERDGYAGGPMYMIRKGLGEKWRPMAAAYALFGVFAAFGVGNATQINAFVAGVNDVQTYFGLPVTDRGNLLLGAVVAVFVWLLLRGGAGRIGRTAEKLVPLAACFYLLLGLGALIVRADRIAIAFRLILQGAFAPKAVTGGLIGSMVTAMGVGASRGVFTNEAGMGTASIAHASAQVDHRRNRGCWASWRCFWTPS